MATMRRTSPTQFDMMVTFMEQHGDLTGSKPSADTRGRARTYQLWEELTNLLNSDASCGEKTEEQWKKVWRDLKSNTKKKAARIHNAAIQIGGDLALHTKLTDLEERVLRVMGTDGAFATGLIEISQATADLAVCEPSTPTVSQVITINENLHQHHPTEDPRLADILDVEISTEEWNHQGQCNQINIGPSDSASAMLLPASEEPIPPQPSMEGQTSPWRQRAAPTRIHKSQRCARLKTVAERTIQTYLQNSDKKWRTFLIAQSKAKDANEKECLRLREMELRVQEQWTVLANRSLDILEKYINK